MSVNQKNITIASFNYLIEVSAIPREIRDEYREKLLKRKNSSQQKNVKLLKYIYDYVNENRMSEWNPKEVSKQTCISINAIYTQKSRLLKGLREYYFKWKEKEREIKTNVEKIYCDGSFYMEGEQTVTLMLEKARKMAEIGMVREAKCMYLKLEKTARSSYINQAYMYLIISEIYEYLSYYYFNKRNKRRVLHCINNLNKVVETVKILNTKTTEEQKAILDIRLNFAKFYSFCIEWYSNPNAEMTSDYLGRVYSLSMKFNNYPFLLKVLHGMAIIELVKENHTKASYTKAKDICMEGLGAALKQKNKAAQLTFSSMLYHIKVNTGLNSHALNNNSIVKYYHKIKNSSPFNLWTIFLENSIVMTYYPEKKKEILAIFREQITSNIMLGDFGFSVYWKFILDAELYNDKLLSFFNIYNIHFKGYLEIKKIDECILDDIKKICLNTECYHTKINDFGLSWLVLKLKLTTYYFREDGFDYDEVMKLLKAMEQMKKKNKNIPGVRTYELLKLCFKMFEHQGNPKYMLNKYELKFKKSVDYLKNNPELTIIDYAIVSSLARRLRQREVTKIVKDFYRWMETNHPEILAPVFRELEEQKLNIHTVTSTGRAA
jgi:hypothetical protein